MKVQITDGIFDRNALGKAYLRQFIRNLHAVPACNFFFDESDFTCGNHNSSF